MDGMQENRPFGVTDYTFFGNTTSEAKGLQLRRAGLGKAWCDGKLTIIKVLSARQTVFSPKLDWELEAIGACTPELVVIDLTKTVVKANQVLALLSPSIRMLILSETNILPAEACHKGGNGLGELLSGLGRSVRYLDISFQPATDAHLQQLGKVCPFLEQLDLTGCEWISPEALGHIRVHFPHLEVLGLEHLPVSEVKHLTQPGLFITAARDGPKSSLPFTEANRSQKRCKVYGKPL